MADIANNPLDEMILCHARELCAALADMDGNWKPAENYRAGLMDDGPKVRQAVAALTCVAELARGEQAAA